MAELAADNFNRGNGGLGASWTTITGRSIPQIVSLQVQDESVGSASAEAIYTDGAWPDNQYAELDMVALASANTSIGVFVRGITASRTGYLFQAIGPTGATATYALYRVNTGAVTTLVSPTTYTITANDRLYLSVVDYVLVGKIAGVQVLSYDDSADGSKLSSGEPGIAVSVAVGSLTDSIIDNFAAGDIGGTPITGLRPAICL
jgi:hypothetical protein